jgi:protein involved in polysaccharide export with SLBB domain
VKKTFDRIVFCSVLAASLLLLVALPKAASAQTPDTSAPSLNQDYLLSPGDVVDVQFFYNPELNQKVQIRPDGRISLRLVGDVELARKTVPAAIRELEIAYKNILKTPSISLQIEGYAAQKVYVGGEVARAGTVSMPGELTVLQALMEAGGPLHSASNKELVLIRRDDQGVPSIHKLSMRNTKDTPSEIMTTKLRAYDIILVPESKISKVDHWVDDYLRKMDPAFITAGLNVISSSHVIP